MAMYLGSNKVSPTFYQASTLSGEVDSEYLSVVSTVSYLQKIIYLTQNQYNTLANGGTVGSMTGLNEDNIYLTPDTSTSSNDVTAMTTSELDQVFIDAGLAIDNS